jgi:hypothetical protein
VLLTILKLERKKKSVIVIIIIITFLSRYDQNRKDDDGIDEIKVIHHDYAIVFQIIFFF